MNARVYIDSETKKLVGSRIAKADFYISMFLWKHRSIVYLAQLALFLFPALIIRQPVAFVPVAVLLLSWIGSFAFYPYRPTIFNFIKFGLLIKGMKVKVDDQPLSFNPNNIPFTYSGIPVYATGTLVGYNPKLCLYIVEIPSDKRISYKTDYLRYYRFKHITPFYYPECYTNSGVDFEERSGWDAS